MHALRATLLALALASPASAVEAPLRVFLHYPAGAAGLQDEAMRLGLLLQDQGFEVVDLRPVAVEMRAPTIRYFEAHLRDEAERLKARLGPLLAERRFGAAPVRVQDFTFYRPKPPENAVELWLPSR